MSYKITDELIASLNKRATQKLLEIRPDFKDVRIRFTSGLKNPNTENEEITLHIHVSGETSDGGVINKSEYIGQLKDANDDKVEDSFQALIDGVSENDIQRIQE